jgi:hypothetical protein
VIAVGLTLLIAVWLGIRCCRRANAVDVTKCNRCSVFAEARQRHAKRAYASDHDRVETHSVMPSATIGQRTHQDNVE